MMLSNDPREFVPRKLVPAGTPSDRRVETDEIDWVDLATRGSLSEGDQRPGYRVKADGNSFHTDHNGTAVPLDSGSSSMPPNNTASWKTYFSSPQFYVVTATLIVLAVAGGMYLSLGSKIEALATATGARIDAAGTKLDAVRLEVKSDIQVSSQRSDTRLDSIISKMDADNRELRMLILSRQRDSQ